MNFSTVLRSLRLWNTTIHESCCICYKTSTQPPSIRLKRKNPFHILNKLNILWKYNEFFHRNVLVRPPHSHSSAYPSKASRDVERNGFYSYTKIIVLKWKFVTCFSRIMCDYCWPLECRRENIRSEDLSFIPRLSGAEFNISIEFHPFRRSYDDVLCNVCWRGIVKR